MASQVIRDKRARERPCLRCGYSLRHILDARHCPECGLSIWLSLNSDDVLDRSNPIWLRRLSWGASVLTLIQAIFAVAALASLIGGRPLYRAMDPLARAMGVSPWQAIWWVAAVYLIPCSAGMFLLAGHERRYPDRLQSWRRLLWVAAVFAAVVGLFLPAQMLGGFGYSFWSYTIWETALGVALLGGNATILAYLRQLARRFPSRRAMRCCEWLMLVPALMTAYVTPCCANAFLIHLGSWPRYVAVGYLPASSSLFAWFAWNFHRAGRESARLWDTEHASASKTSGGEQT